MTAFETESQWKSPRKIEVEIRDYKRHRFEEYMKDVDMGRIALATALAELRSEMEYVEL